MLVFISKPYLSNIDWYKLLLLCLFGLVLLWLYTTGVKSTIPVDYCSSKKSFIIWKVNWYLSSNYTIIITEGGILNKPATLNLEKIPFHNNIQVNQSTLVATASILKWNVLGDHLSWKTLFFHVWVSVERGKKLRDTVQHLLITY